MSPTTPEPAAHLSGTCSAACRALGEPLAGTAPYAPAWLAVEQPGPWGRDALAASRLPPRLAGALRAQAAATGVRVALVRRAGRHPADPNRPRTLLAAHTRPGAAWVEQATLTDVAELADADLARLAAGSPLGLGRRVGPPPGPLWLVCTNARRDRCCALRGRPLAAALAGELGADRVWETSHLGGHRFAPTAVLLPAGAVYGQLDLAAALRVDAEVAGGRLPLAGLRGRAAWPPAAQAAEVAVREHAGAAGLDEVLIEPADRNGEVTGGPELVRVRLADGRRYDVTVARRPLPPARPESCGGPPVTLQAWTVTALRPA